MIFWATEKLSMYGLLCLDVRSCCRICESTGMGARISFRLTNPWDAHIQSRNVTSLNPRLLLIRISCDVEHPVKNQYVVVLFGLEFRKKNL